jgi:hypothetical protein
MKRLILASLILWPVLAWAQIIGSGFSGDSKAAGCAAATSYLARTTGGNEGGNAANITTLVCGLVSDGVWSSLDFLHLDAQQNVTDAKLNLASSSFALQTDTGGAATFTSYQGFSGFHNGMLMGYNVSSGGLQYTRNSASCGVWAYTMSASTANFHIGDNSNDQMYIWYSDGNWYPRINNNSGGGLAHPGTAGLFVGDRPSSTTVHAYWNGVDKATISSTSTGLGSANMVLANFGASNTIFSADFCGASLGASGELALYNRLRTYMTAVGVP